MIPRHKAWKSIGHIPKSSAQELPPNTRPSPKYRATHNAPMGPVMSPRAMGLFKINPLLVHWTAKATNNAASAPIPWVPPEKISDPYPRRNECMRDAVEAIRNPQKTTMDSHS